MALRREKIAARLAELREQHSLTQEQAAARTGVTLRQWQRWEYGESIPYPRNLDAIASKFGLSVAEFFDETENGILKDEVTALRAEVTELRAGLAALASDILLHTQELQALRGKGRPKRSGEVDG